MLLILRVVILGFLLLLAFIFGGLFCLLRPRHRNNVFLVAQMFSAVAPILGIKVLVKRSEPQLTEPCIYLANHQNNYDLYTHTAAVPKGTVSLGKKSLVWIPLFGQLYWLSGNILINRKNRSKAVETMAAAAKQIKEKALSVWIFPEGTRSRGRGLLPFKSGAFHTAISAQVPVVPVLASSQQHIKLNRWNNGVVIVNVMSPIATTGLTKTDVKDFTTKVHTLMTEKLRQIDAEAKKLNKNLE